MKALKHFTRLKVIQAIGFLFIPLILVIVNGEMLGSVSAFANFTPLTFASLLTLAAALFVYDGFVHRSRWINLVIGFMLLGVVFFNHLHYPVTHYIFAGSFFFCSIFSMVYFSSDSQRWFKSIAGGFILFGLFGCFLFHWYSIFLAEWIGMIPISLHFILEATGKID